jgi:type IV secretory pathway TrbD component
VKQAEGKPEGWFVPMVSVAPPRILGVERIPMVLVGSLAGMLAALVGPRAHGDLFGIPCFWLVEGLAAGIFFGGLALLKYLWRKDPWMSQTHLRFIRWSRYIPAHATGASSDAYRFVERTRKHLHRGGGVL